MAKRVGIVLSGVGDGNEIHEAVIALVAVERAGGVAVFAAPQGTAAEAARIAGGPVRDLATLAVDDVDALVFPGGAGVRKVLSNYDERGAVCDVNADVARLLKACMPSQRPMGFVSLAPLLAARVLGPVAGVRLTLGARGTVAAKNAAVMGADVRPCPVRDLVIDQKHRVVSTPGHTYDDARALDVAIGMEKLVRTVLSFARDRAPRPSPAEPGGSAASPRRGEAIPDRDSGGSGRGPSGTRPPRSRSLLPGS